MNLKPILYILDDDVLYADLLMEVAINEGWLVTSMQSASSFLACNFPEKIVLVLDLQMPEIDGIEVIRELADKKVDLLLILISGFDSRVLHSAQQLAEAHDITVLTSLTKPINIQEFILILQSIKESNFSSKKLVTKEPVTVQELEFAIKQHQLVLHYQPQLDMETGSLQGVEALVRWKHPILGMVFPDQFISLAEKNNLIGALTEEVINMAAQQSQRWQLEGLDTIISVNVSAENITSLSLPEQLIELTNKHTLSPENFALEMTETSVMGKLTSSLDVLNRLRMKGFSLSIDDFGTGYSSLSYLYQAPFKELKIDQCFVMRMLKDRDALVIVEICIMLGHKLGMKLVAEGVETEEIWNKLRALNCDKAQGYFIAKPMSAEKLFQWQNERL